MAIIKCLTKVSLGQVFNNEVQLIIGNFLDSFLTSDSNTKNNIVFNPDDLFGFDKVITHKAIDNQKNMRY